MSDNKEVIVSNKCGKMKVNVKGKNALEQCNKIKQAFNEACRKILKRSEENRGEEDKSKSQ
ncbi:MAG: hypothetical protein BAJALOKI1v1_2560006 [Promethearchaeota archaeon]|nr:MAG: hypothetical protein BAJALOKI1v1_2560006 [Candidatus Lokiarchaeota archaeon]